jgi:hypothetical protein
MAVLYFVPTANIVSASRSFLIICWAEWRLPCRFFIESLLAQKGG